MRGEGAKGAGEMCRVAVVIVRVARGAERVPDWSRGESVSGVEGRIAGWVTVGRGACGATCARHPARGSGSGRR